MSGSSCSILYTIFAWFLGMCYGFVLLSSAAGQNGELALFKNGEYFKYQWKTTTLLSEKSDNTKNVGFSITGNVLIEVVWGNEAKKLLKIQVRFCLMFFSHIFSTISYQYRYRELSEQAEQAFGIYSRLLRKIADLGKITFSCKLFSYL